VTGPAQHEPAIEVVHHCPVNPSGLTPCCRRTPLELPRTDRLTIKTGEVTCAGFRLPRGPEQPTQDVAVQRLTELRQQLVSMSVAAIAAADVIALLVVERQDQLAQQETDRG
jgi:hypothetical protein